MNIYVSHLSWGTKSDSLQNLFSQYGEVSSANVITDRETGRSRGFGFVEMPNETEGQAAIDALDGTDFEGKTIGVNVAKPKADRPAGGYGGGNRGGGYGGGYGNITRLSSRAPADLIQRFHAVIFKLCSHFIYPPYFSTIFYFFLHEIYIFYHLVYMVSKLFISRVSRSVTTDEMSMLVSLIITPAL